MKTVALFPGQGSQHVGMLKELHENFKTAREAFEEASDATGLHLRKLAFEGPESELTMTENTQPCLLTASVAAFRVFREETGFQPDFVAGHSLGEYSALVAAGAFPLSSAVRWVRERGKSMQSAVPAGMGGMAALMGMDDAKVDELCAAAVASASAKRTGGENAGITVACALQAANYNAPGQTVVAGSKDAIDEALALLKAGGAFAGGKAVPLNVSAPFHSALMEKARARMADIFRATKEEETPKALSCPYFPNRTARETYEPSAVFELLVDQVDHSVLWRQSVEAMIRADVRRAIEFGPGKVLQGLNKRIASPLGASLASFGVNDLKTLAEAKKGLTE